MNFSRRTATKSRPTVTQSIWEETRTQFLHEIGSHVMVYNIQDELMFNADQTPSKYVSTTKVTMPSKDLNTSPYLVVMINIQQHSLLLKAWLVRCCHCKSFTKVKMKDAFPRMVAMIRTLYFHTTKSIGAMKLKDCAWLTVYWYHISEKWRQIWTWRQTKKSLLIWDAFKAQSTPQVKARLAELDIVDVFQKTSANYYSLWTLPQMVQ